MKKLSELSDETLLYIGIFNDLKNIIPEVKVVTKKRICQQSRLVSQRVLVWNLSRC